MDKFYKDGYMKPVDIMDTIGRMPEIEPEVQRKGRRPHMKGVEQWTLDGVYVKTFDSIVEAARATGISKENISAVVRGCHRIAGGFTWKYKKDGGNDIG